MNTIIPQHVSIDRREDLDFWCRYFSCTPKDLQEAVSKMGVCAEEVKLYLIEKPSRKGLSFWWEYMK